MVACLRVVEALAVEQHQRLGERAAAYRKVGLYAIGSAFLKVERGIGTQQVLERVEHQADRARRQQRDGAVHLIERERLEGARYHHGFMLRGGHRLGRRLRRSRLLGNNGEGQKEYRKKRGAQFFIVLGARRGLFQLSLDSEVSFGEVAFPRRKTKEKQVLYQGTA